MVRLSLALMRVPVIKFRKGGSGRPAAPAGSSLGSCPAVRSPPAGGQAQPAAAMSSSTIPDVDLPARYRRQPLSQQEIDTINGGGIA